jgi:cytochrome c553
MRLIPCADRRVLGLFVKCLIFGGFTWSVWFTSSPPGMVGVDFRTYAAEPETTRPALMLYKKYCARCHQVDGSGSRSRSVETPDFTRLVWQRERGDVQLLISIREGKGRAMPGFGDRLSDKEIEEQVAFVRMFAPSIRGESSRAKGTDFDARFRKLELELAELRRAFWELHASSEEN